MSISPENKKEVVSSFAVKEGDTGSPEVQVAVMTHRIRALSEHMKIHKKDFHSRRGLIILVGKRRRLLDYLAKKNNARYQSLIQRLDLRR